MDKKIMKMFEESIFGVKSVLKGSLVKRELGISQKELNELVKEGKIIHRKELSGGAWYSIAK